MSLEWEDIDSGTPGLIVLQCEGRMGMPPVFRTEVISFLVDKDAQHFSSVALIFRSTVLGHDQS
jgi:hypothetical protein